MVGVLKRRDVHLHNALVGAAVPDHDVIYKNHDDAKIRMSQKHAAGRRLTHCFATASICAWSTFGLPEEHIVREGF